MRFRTDTPGPSSTAFMGYTRIATFLKVSATLVRAVCRSALEGQYPTSPGKQNTSKRLAKEHLDFLLSDETLK